MAQADILDILAQERTEVTAFIALLTQESEVLGQPEALDALETLTRLKALQAESLRALGESRDAWLREQGHGEGHAAMQAAVEKNAYLAEPWAALLENVSQASAQNQENGALIGAHMADTQEKLDTLRRLQAGTSDVYNARGLPQGARSGRPLAAG